MGGGRVPAEATKLNIVGFVHVTTSVTSDRDKSWTFSILCLFVHNLNIIPPFQNGCNKMIVHIVAVDKMGKSWSYWIRGKQKWNLIVNFRSAEKISIQKCKTLFKPCVQEVAEFKALINWLGIQARGFDYMVEKLETKEQI